MSILPDPETFRSLADGSLTGIGPAAARRLLAALAVPYAAITASRNLLYDRGLFRQQHARVPVISVGNITVGGTGKTPLVAWICRRLVKLGRHPAIVSRGYAARPGEQSDEAAELAILVPGIPHRANRDRVAAADVAARGGADAIVLDDGFQHRRLWRDLDIVAIDATDPFGCGHLLPRGLLREAIGGLVRADAIVLTRASSVPVAARHEIRGTVTRARGGTPPRVWLETEHRPVAVRTSSGMTEPLEAFRGRRVAAFCGIGNPAAFRHTLTGAGIDVVGFRSFADHHPYDAGDLDMLAQWSSTVDAEQVLTTLKDLVRIGEERLGDLPLAAVEVALEPIGKSEDLDKLIEETLCAGNAAQP
jgi:tetraacyldisaccharide 4'-kinase